VRPTRPTALIALAIIGGALVYAAELILVRLGSPIITPPVTLAVALALLGVIIPILAWPIRQATRGDKTTLVVDPFYATRVLLISKAGSLTAASLSGGALGVLVFLLGRMVIVWPQVVVSSLAIVGGLVMLAGALIAERWCVVPPSDGAESTVAAEGEPA
jgi:hypothetical protein